MDKYEFNIKVEQIKKMVDKEDFVTAMKIADTIDWRRVRNANLLSTISQVYEKNGEYQEAKEVLLLAFERAPIGKRFLYKLTELALKEGSIREAEDYYREFCRLAPEDTRQHILRYLILKEKKASSDQLIQVLERYTKAELDEKWMYELAKLYARAGRTEDCVQLCDKMILLFGIGSYVEKATELKQQYAPSGSTQRTTAQTQGHSNYGGTVITMPEASGYNGNWQNSGGGYEAGPGVYGNENNYETGAGYGSRSGYGTEQSYGPVGGFGTGTGYNTSNTYYPPNTNEMNAGYDSGNGYGTGMSYRDDNGYGTEPGYDSGNSYEAGPGYDSGNGYEAGPGYDSGNGYEAGPGYDSGNSYEAGPGYDSGNDYGTRTGYNGENGYESAIGYGSGNNYVSGSINDSESNYGFEGNYGNGSAYNFQGGYGTGTGYGSESGYGTGQSYNPESGYEAGPEYDHGNYPENAYEVNEDYYGQNGYESGQVYDAGVDYGSGMGDGAPDGYGGNDYRREESYDRSNGNYHANAGYGNDGVYGVNARSDYSGRRNYRDNRDYRDHTAHETDSRSYGRDENYGTGASHDSATWPAAGPYIVDEELMANLHQAAAEKELAAEMSRISTEEYMEPEPMSNQTRVFRGKNNIRVLRPRYEEEEKPFYHRSYTPHHMIIEAEDVQEGIESAIGELRKIHQETGVDNPVIKITGSKLSKRGIINVSDKLAGKDLIVEKAGDLTQRDLEELQMLLERDETGMIVVLIDNSYQIELLHQENPGFINLFKCIGSEKNVKQPESPEQAAEQPEKWVQEEAYHEEESELSMSESQSESMPAVEIEQEPQTETKLVLEAEAQPETEGILEPEPEFNPEVKPEPELEMQSQPQPEPEPERNPVEAPSLEQQPQEKEFQEFADGKDLREAPENPEKGEIADKDENPEKTLQTNDGFEDSEQYEEEEYLEDEYPENEFSEEEYPDEDEYQDADLDEETYDGDYGEEEYGDVDSADPDEELGIDAFADYAVQYASDIDCSITGKSLLALYQHVESMEENGIPLTRANAEDMIEEAADKAEKPSFSGLIKGVFSSKYDKEGLLILKEEHFL